jgi:hypothetical protein
MERKGLTKVSHHRAGKRHESLEQQSLKKLRFDICVKATKQSEAVINIS